LVTEKKIKTVSLLEERPLITQKLVILESEDETELLPNLID